jgi:hypothetical protein
VINDKEKMVVLVDKRFPLGETIIVVGVSLSKLRNENHLLFLSMEQGICNKL